MQVVVFNVAALSIALLYYAWRDAIARRMLRNSVLRERVAFMLWTAANQAA